MSLPGGIGASDILTACKFIYDICMKYRAAREEFEEIAEKARATEVVIERLEIEQVTGGSLVERANDNGKAAQEFKEHLDGLRSDLDKLKKLVSSYASIHDEGKGRRLLWAVWESGNLTEYRRKIAYHEHKLQLWYMTLVYGSLGRIETRQEEMLRGIERLPKDLEKVLRDVLKKQKDPKPLIRKLEDAGVPPEVTRNSTNIRLATTYLNSSPEDQCKITENVIRRSQESRTSGPHDGYYASNGHTSGAYPDFRGGLYPDDFHRRPGPAPPPPGRQYNTYYSMPNDWRADFDAHAYEPTSSNDWQFDSSFKPTDFSGLHRSKSANQPRAPRAEEARKDRTHKEDRIKNTYVETGTGEHLRPAHARRVSDAPQNYRSTSPRAEGPKTERTHKEDRYGATYVKVESREDLRPRHARRASDIPQIRRSKSPLIIINNEGPREQPKMGHGRARSTSETSGRAAKDSDPVIIVEEAVPHRSRSRAGSNTSRHRDSSTSSYHRHRNRSSSGGSDVNVRQYRYVKKMDRIDSLPIDDDKK